MRQRDLRLGRPVVWLALAMSGTLLVGTGEGGNVMAANAPVPVREQAHRLAEAPVQPWGQHVTAASEAQPRNNTVPASLRQQYPLRSEPEVAPPEQNKASVLPSPVQYGMQHSSGFDPQTSVEVAERRDAYNRVYTNADGTETTATSDTPLKRAG